jgi:hypothetical protein
MIRDEALRISMAELKVDISVIAAVYTGQSTLLCTLLLQTNNC